LCAIINAKHISRESGGCHSDNLKIILKIHAFIPKKKQEFSTFLRRKHQEEMNGEK